MLMSKCEPALTLRVRVVHNCIKRLYGLKYCWCVGYIILYSFFFILYSLKLYNFSLFRVYLRIVFLTVALHSLQTWIVISLCSWVRLIDWQGQIYDFVDVGGVVTWCYWYLGVVKSMGHTTKNASVCELEPNWKLLQGLLPKPESLNYALLSQYKNMIGFC